MITTIATLLSPYLFKWGFSSLDNAKRTAERVAWFIVLAVIALLLFGVMLLGKACYTNSQIDETGQQIDAIRQEQSNAGVAKDAVTIEANTAKVETEKQRQSRAEAVKKLEEARKSDSSKEQADAWIALQRYCSNYKDDSLCEKK